MIYEKLNDFRVNTREAFNSAEAGGFVYVIRHKKVFELKLLPYVTPDDIKVQTVDLQSGINAGTDLHPTTAARVYNVWDGKHIKQATLPSHEVSDPVPVPKMPKDFVGFTDGDGNIIEPVVEPVDE